MASPALPTSQIQPKDGSRCRQQHANVVTLSSSRYGPFLSGPHPGRPYEAPAAGQNILDTGIPTLWAIPDDHTYDSGPGHHRRRHRRHTRTPRPPACAGNARSGFLKARRRPHIRCHRTNGRPSALPQATHGLPPAEYASRHTCAALRHQRNSVPFPHRGSSQPPPSLQSISTRNAPLRAARALRGPPDWLDPAALEISESIPFPALREQGTP